MTPIRIAYAKVAPGAAQAMYAANSYFDGCSIPQLLRRLVELRVSQINGCSYCIWLHSRQIKELGETGGMPYGDRTLARCTMPQRCRESCSGVG